MTPETHNSAIPDILVEIVERRRQHLKAAGGLAPSLVASPMAPCTISDNAFLDAIAKHAGAAVIAEVKMGSPSLGSLEGSFDPVARARAYAEGGAACLSVVVEPDFFYGSYALLKSCVEASGLPAIAKDFIVDPLQMRWALESGASAILLIAALYSPEDLRSYANTARSLGLVPLIETHDAADVAKLGDERWELVGVNNRDLRTFNVSLDTSHKLYASLPENAFKVAESGIHSGADRSALSATGFDAFLIGEALVTSGDPQAKLAELLKC